MIHSHLPEDPDPWLVIVALILVFAFIFGFGGFLIYHLFLS